MPRDDYDALIVGGGFYGCAIAELLARHGRRAVICEREPTLLSRASYNNQARVHQGYHYPRSFLTGLRSALNFERFVAEFRECIDSSFTHVYAIARGQSRTNAYQFREFCGRIGAPLTPAPREVRAWFDTARVEDVWLAREYAFNAVALRDRMAARLTALGVETRHGTTVMRITRGAHGLTAHLADGAALAAREVFNATYSGINVLQRASGLPLLPLKHELTEMALVQLPEPLREYGFTIMDGPFFSTMPFPARGLHTFSHVRYTPQAAWLDAEGVRDGYTALRDAGLRTAFPYMLRDALRLMPALRGTEQRDSLFEVKTILLQNEEDDGRPILLRRDCGVPGLWVVMGGKIDNVYDVLKAVGAGMATPAAVQGCA